VQRVLIVIIFAVAGLAACSWGYNDYGLGYGAEAPPPHPVYRGRAWAAPRAPYQGPLSGLGVAQLDDWLKDTPEGRAIVTLGFRDAAYGVISVETADRANLWFRHYADTNHDLVLTDAEIRTALVAAAGRYMHHDQG
jgi:hypothetical protein